MGIEECISLLDVPITSNFSTLLVVPRFSNSLLSFVHPESLRFTSDFILKKVIGREVRFLQSLTLNEARPVKFPIDVGKSVIPVLSK